MPPFPSDLIKGPFAIDLGMKVVDAGAGFARVRLDVQPKHLNRHEMLHGGVMACLLDTTCGLSCILDETGEVAREVVTVSLTTNFLRGVPVGTIIASGRLRSGRRTLSVDCDCHDADGHLMATAMGVFQVVRRDSLKAAISAS